MIMIGVSTGQNITNLIPAVQQGMKVTKFVLLETSTAISRKWSQGLLDVLKQREISVECISLEGIDSHISNIQTKLFDTFKDEKKPMIWNLGGGQKPQQIPIWEVFKMRNEVLNIPDIVCYANQDDTGILEIWEYQNGNITTRTEKISVDLSAEEIFKVFGFDFLEQPQKIYDRKRVVNYPQTNDLFIHQEFRQYLFEVASFYSNKREEKFSIDDIKSIVSRYSSEFESEIFNIIQSQNIHQKNVAIRSLLLGSNKKNGLLESKLRESSSDFSFKLQDEKLKILISQIISNNVEYMPNDIVAKLGLSKNTTGDYFEKILIDRVKAKLESTTEHNVIEAYANLKTQKNGQAIAEYDILCVTEKGTIIALDAKTFSFEKKDIDARLYNLEQGSGFYRTFSAIFPYDTADFEREWFKPIKNLPFDLSKRRLSFYVVNDSENCNFWIKQENDTIVKTFDKPDKTEIGWLECKTWDNFLKQK